MMRHSSTEENKKEWKKNLHGRVSDGRSTARAKHVQNKRRTEDVLHIFFFLKKIIYNININIGNTALWLEPRDILGPFFMIIVIKTIGHVRKKKT